MYWKDVILSVYFQVAAVDLLGAWVGELCGGSLREERYDMLNSKLKELELDSALDW